jgi:hypothetical protein
MAATSEALDKLIDKTRAVKGGERPERLAETAKYLTDLLLEMRNIANRSEMKFLTYLLEMAYYEAFSIANKVDLAPSDMEKLREISRQTRNEPMPPGPAQQVA